MPKGVYVRTPQALENLKKAGEARRGKYGRQCPSDCDCGRHGEAARQRMLHARESLVLTPDSYVKAMETKRAKGIAGWPPAAREAQRVAVTTHGFSGHPHFSRWSAMMGRCFSPGNPKYAAYGGRGITVCDEWQTPGPFIAYLETQLGPCPPGYTMDRIDNNGNYEPGNIRWASALQQSRNRRPASDWKKYGE